MAVQSVHEHDIDALGESMLEEISRTAKHRLRQIEPLIEEAQRLRGVLEVIEGRTLTPIASASTTAVGAGAHQAASASGTGRAAKGANKRIILDLVAKRPGITAAEIADVTGVKRTVVASTVSRLKRHGELREHSQGGVCLAKPRAVAEPDTHA